MPSLERRNNSQAKVQGRPVARRRTLPPCPARRQSRLDRTSGRLRANWRERPKSISELLLRAFYVVYNAFKGTSVSRAKLCLRPSLTGIELSQQVPCLAEERSNGPSLGDRISGEAAMLARIPISSRRAASRRAAVHPAARLAVHRWRATRAAVTCPGPTARARAHRRGVAGVAADHAVAACSASMGRW